MSVNKKSNKALFIVDLQNDFCPGGALAVKDGDKIIPVINELMKKFEWVLASKDWHPKNSIHFDKWPKHCVQNTEGAKFHPKLKSKKIKQIFFKGSDNKDDGYSAFEATNINLNAYLKKQNINELFITGLATDYCVKSTALDALKNGYKTYVITDAIKAVNIHPEDHIKALEDMEKNGCILVDSDSIL